MFHARARVFVVAVVMAVARDTGDRHGNQQQGGAERAHCCGCREANQRFQYVAVPGVVTTLKPHR